MMALVQKGHDGRLTAPASFVQPCSAELVEVEVGAEGAGVGAAEALVLGVLYSDDLGTGATFAGSVLAIGQIFRRRRRLLGHARGLSP